MSEPKLLPCPFCGRMLEDIGDEHFERHPFEKDGCPLNSSTVYLPHWNRRAPVLTPERIEALELLIESEEQSDHDLFTVWECENCGHKAPGYQFTTCSKCNHIHQDGVDALKAAATLRAWLEKEK